MRDAQGIAGIERSRQKKIQSLQQRRHIERLRCSIGSMSPPKVLYEHRRVARDIGDYVFGFGHECDKQFVGRVSTRHSRVGINSDLWKREIDEIAHRADERCFVR